MNTAVFQWSTVCIQKQWLTDASCWHPVKSVWYQAVLISSAIWDILEASVYALNHGMLGSHPRSWLSFLCEQESPKSFLSISLVEEQVSLVHFYKEPHSFCFFLPVMLSPRGVSKNWINNAEKMGWSSELSKDKSIYTFIINFLVAMSSWEEHHENTLSLGHWWSPWWASLTVLIAYQWK